MKLGLMKEKLTIKSFNPIHKNHNSDKHTFSAYPENVRLKEEEVVEASKMIACGSSKQKLKAYLSKGRDAPVTLKVLHNLQTKINFEKESPESSNALRNLIDMILKTLTAKVRVVENDKEEFVGT